MRRGFRVRIARGEGICGRAVGKIEIIVAELREIRSRLKHRLHLRVGISVALALIAGKQTVFVHIRRKQYAVIRHIPCKVGVVAQLGKLILLSCYRILTGDRKSAAAEILAVENIGEQVEFAPRTASLLPFGGKRDHLLTAFLVVVKISGNDILVPPPSRA